jgi:hypothetical protein
MTNMATFYVLPNRDVLGGRLASFLQSLLPGLEARYPTYTDLADVLVEMAEKHNDVFVVFREDLTGSNDILASLQDIFGADEGDTVVEIEHHDGQNTVVQEYQITIEDDANEPAMQS